MSAEYEPEKERREVPPPHRGARFERGFCELLSSLQRFSSGGEISASESEANGVPIRLVIYLTFVFTALGPRRHQKLNLGEFKVEGLIYTSINEVK